MQASTIRILLAASLVLPLAAVSPAASQEATTAPDVAVTGLSVGHLLFPATKFSLAATVCNLGDAAVPAGSTVSFASVARDGPLRQAAGGVAAAEREARAVTDEVFTGGPSVQGFASAYRSMGTQVLASGLAPGQCVVARASWGEPYHLGEYDFHAVASAAGDSDASNDVRVAAGATPDALLGSGLGGV